MTETTELAVLPRSSLPTILAADQNDILGKLAAELHAFLHGAPAAGAK